MPFPSLFARLLPYDIACNAYDLFQKVENSHLCVAEPRTILDCSSRDATPFDEEDETLDEKAKGRVRLELWLNDDNSDAALKDPSVGWQFGSSTQVSDVFLGHPGTPNVSRRHFAISVTADLRIRLLQQTARTTLVTYCKENVEDQQVRPQQNDALYIALSPSEEHYWDQVRISFGTGDNVTGFNIHFPNHNMAASAEYLCNLKRFVQTGESAAPALGLLGLDSTFPTAIASRQSPTPCPVGSLCYRKRLERGAFGVVELLVDLQTANKVARKTLMGLDAVLTGGQSAARLQREMKKMWNEVRLMQDNPHPNIMPILAYQEDPTPGIIMPYFPLGNITSVEGLTWSHYLSAFRQLLIVIDYLHSRGVAHRDLKPANILVESVDPMKIVVSDFGLSRAVTPESNTLMKTVCGTKLYAAPEVFPAGDPRVPGQNEGYWLSVDIWSAGVIMLQWTFNLPDTMGMGNRQSHVFLSFWSRALANAVQRPDRDSYVIIQVLRHMIVREPKNRFTAMECLELGCQLDLFKRARSGDFVDFDEEDSLDEGARTPTQKTFAAASNPVSSLPPSAMGLDSKPEDSEIWFSAREEPEKEDNQSGISEWQKFLDYDAFPVNIDATEIDDDTGNSESQEFVSAEQDVSPPPDPEPQYTHEPEPVTKVAIRRTHTIVEEVEPRYSLRSRAGQKRNHSGSGSMQDSLSASIKAPTKKKTKDKSIRVGYNSAVWSGIIGSNPHLSVEQHELPTPVIETASSVCIIDWNKEEHGEPRLSLQEGSSSYSMVEDATNMSVQMK